MESCQQRTNKRDELPYISSLQQLDCESYEQEVYAQRLPDSESLTGWQTPLTEFKPSATKKKKSKRTDNQVWNGERKVICSYSDGVWEGSVEKYSYRYIPNNGCYKRIKTQTIPVKQSFSQRKPVSPTAGVVYSSEHRKLQREITMDLQKEFQSLLENNRKYFRLLNESPSAAEDYLEDEEEFREKITLITSQAGKPISHSIRPNTASKEVKVETNSSTVIPSSSLDAPHTNSLPTPSTNALLHTNSTVVPTTQSNSFPSMQSNLLPTIQSRPLETQSALSIPTRLEDLIIQKRCSTNLDKLALEQAGNGGVFDKPPTKYDKSQYKHTVLPTTSRVYVNTNDVEDLANKTFSNRKGNVETRTKQLKPIEKITPSLREVYDNSKAMIEMMKYSSTLNTGNSNVSIGLSGIATSRLTNQEALPSDSLLISKPKAISKTAFGTSVPASTYKVAKLGEARQKLPILRTIDEQYNNTYQTFLPSISGKRISTKLASLR